MNKASPSYENIIDIHHQLLDLRFFNTFFIIQAIIEMVLATCNSIQTQQIKLSI